MMTQLKPKVSNVTILSKIIILTCMFITTTAHSGALQDSSPSFDCTVATTTDEKIVCGSSELSSLDKQLAQRYQNAAQIDTQIDKAALKNSQLAWLKLRATCHYSFDCLKAAYQKRLNEISTLTPPGYAFSWGGNYRQAPSLDAVRLGSFKLRQRIKIISKTEVLFNNYHWFKIEVSGQEVYQWGGILCSPIYPDSTYCE